MQTDLGVDRTLDGARGRNRSCRLAHRHSRRFRGESRAHPHFAARDIGLVALGTTVAGIAMIPAVLGLDTGVIRFVARAAASDDERRARASAQAALLVTALTSGALTIVLWLTAPWICDHFFHKGFATHVVQIVSLSLPALALGRVASAATQGFGVMRYSAWTGIIRRPLRLLALLPLLAVGLNARTLAGGDGGCSLGDVPDLDLLPASRSHEGF